MTRKKCKRKVWALLNPLEHVLDGLKVTPDYKLDQLHIRELAALEAMIKGQAGVQEWSDLSSVLNICEGMAMAGVGAEALPDCVALQEELKAAARRFDETKRMGLTARGIKAAREVIDWHNLQRRSVSLAEYEQHIARVTKRILGKAKEVEEI
jgi:hypothetical protein